MKKLRRIIIGDRNYPIKIDLNVLEHIQENYGSISQFEMDILGLKLTKDADGNLVYTEDGKAVDSSTIFEESTTIYAHWQEILNLTIN